MRRLTSCQSGPRPSYSDMVDNTQLEASKASMEDKRVVSHVAEAAVVVTVVAEEEEGIAETERIGDMEVEVVEEEDMVEIEAVEAIVEIEIMIEVIEGLILLD